MYPNLGKGRNLGRSDLAIALPNVGITPLDFSAWKYRLMTDFTILVVDDDDVDREIIERALRRLKFNNPLVCASNGQDALSFLRGTDDREKLREPYLILLDINMPGMSGLEFLKELRGDEHLCRSIVFVLTTSAHEQDIFESYGCNVAGYLVKSRVDQTFQNNLSMLHLFCSVIKPPV